MGNQNKKDYRPFIQALFLRAGNFMDSAARELKEKVDNLRPIKISSSSDEYAFSCAVAISYKLTIDAAKAINHNAIFLPYEKPSKYTSIIVSFSVFILSVIHQYLKIEGINLDFNELAISTAELFCLFQSKEDQSKVIFEGIETFRFIALSKNKNIEQWIDNLNKLIEMYVLQWTSKDNKFKNKDFIPFFGSLLKSLLITVD